jgi:hypothetical protein
MKLKLPLFILAFLFVIGSTAGQEIFNVRNQASNNLKILEEGIKKHAPDAVLTSSQLIKLEKIFIKSNQEKRDLIKAGTHKSDFVEQTFEIDEKYLPTIESILNEKQKLALRKLKAEQQIRVN